MRYSAKIAKKGLNLPKNAGKKREMPCGVRKFLQAWQRTEILEKKGH